MTTSKNYQGKTFTFTKDRGQYKVSAIGFNHYWFQSTKSVREANRILKQITESSVPYNLVLILILKVLNFNKI